MKNLTPPRAENEIAERLLELLPQRTFATDRPSEDGTHKRQRRDAINYSYIQLNPKKLTRYLVFDLDYRGALLACDDANLPPPTWIVVNPSNGHVVYELAAPVCVSAKARAKPVEFLEAVRRGYARRARPGQ